MKQKLSSVGKAKLRESSRRLYANCESVDDAKAARVGVELLEKIALARESLNVGEPLVLKELQPGQSTPEALRPHLPALLAQAKGLVLAKHRHCINEPRLTQEAASSLMRLVPLGEYQAMAKLLAAAAKE